MNARFYDHAKNLTNPAQAAAVARVRREVIAEGSPYRVDFSNSRGERLFFDGGRYDVLSLAKDLLFNGCNPVMTAPCGGVLDIAAARY